MRDILFERYSPLDLNAANAPASGEKLNICIRIHTELRAESVTLHLNCDGREGETLLPMSLLEDGGEYARYGSELSIDEPGLYFFRFSAELGGSRRPIGFDGGGAELDCTEGWQLTVYDAAFSTPKWISGSLYYQIFTDRFSRGGEARVADKTWGETPDYKPEADGTVLRNDHFGGNLAGITEKLDYLAALGVGCIYLCPIFEAESNHKYDTADFMKIDSRYGSEEDLRTLCAEAKKLGMRVILDGVFDHTGSNSVYFNKDGRYGRGGAYNSQESPYYNWYQFTRWNDIYACWWGIDTMPQLNELEPSYMDFITGAGGVLEKWMDCGVSGWRLDVADELPDEFIAGLRRTVKAKNPDALVIGEVWEDASSKIAYGERRKYLQGFELDGVTNYPFKNAIIDYLKSGSAEGIAGVVKSVCANYPKPALDCMMNILGTHDTPRIITVLGGEECGGMDEMACAKMDAKTYASAKELLKIASVLQFTLPGVPCIYYGDEAGMEGYDDPFCRRCFPWGEEDTELTDWYRALSGLRRSHPCFDGGDFHTLSESAGVYAFSREKWDDCCTIICNMGARDYRAEGRVLLSGNCETVGGAVYVRHRGFAVIA